MDCTECRLLVLDGNTIHYDDDREPEVKKGWIWGDSWEETLNRELSAITIKRLNHWVATYESFFQREDLQLLGQHLYEILFRDKQIRKTFETTYRWFEKRRADRVSDAEMRLRLRLDFKKPALELASYPWEFLFMPRDKRGDVETAGFFLAGGKTELILTRFVPGPGSRDLKPEEPPLRILIAFSHPKELDIVGDQDVTDAIKNIKQLETDKNTQGVLSGNCLVEQLDNPTHSQLKDKIKIWAPHIVHFIGHGKAGKIALMKKEKLIEFDPIQRKKGPEADWIDSPSVCSLFAAHKPRLVFLHACNGAAADSLDSFKNTAGELVSFGIPAVVAMQYGISNEDAGAFAKVFYEQIGYGKDIDEAVKAGRFALATQAPAWDHRRFGTPVVYLQSEKPIVYVKSLPPKNGDPPPTATKVPCPYPDNCTGMVMPDWVRCTKCKRPLMKCPDCKSAMAKDIKMCGNCGYEVPSVAAATSAPMVSPSSGLGGNLAG